MGCGSSKEAGNTQPTRLHKHPDQGTGQQQQYQAQSQQPPQPPQPPQAQVPQASQATGYPVQSHPGSWPRVITLGTIPVTVYVYPHTLGSGQEQRSCWSYISQGLESASQPDIVFTIARRANEHIEAYPEAPFEWIKTVYAIANGGIHLQTGQLVELVFDRDAAFLKINQIMVEQNAQSWQCMSRFGSLCHGIPLSSSIFDLPAGVIPPAAHHVIALTPEETVVANQFGVTRVVGHLGLSVRWFPYPPWIDIDRGDVTNMADQAGSVRIGVPIARMYGLNAMFEEDDIILTIPPNEELRKVFREYVGNLSPEAAAGFESFMVEGADSGLLWKKGQKDRMGYASHCNTMKRLNLGFLMFAPQQEDDSCIMVEDGYGILIRDTTWELIREAIRNTQDIIVPLKNDKRFLVQWSRAVYHNPMDGGSYTASWRTYNSSAPARPSETHVNMKQIVFLVEPPNGAISASEMSEYIKAILNIVEEQTPVQPLPAPPGFNHPGRQAIIEFQLPKCEGWLKMTAYPCLDGIDVQSITQRVAALPAPETRSVAKLQLYLDLWGYQGPAAQFS
ncbi:hypothetical protein P154DRAFT_558740 [Amniculicola lignicola CBS 123094]|uniref:Uncharacterized protein n=1 Tax=Amniculicola lignicola CBS 123094 TaxID=1392246 RepID=A0A6A5X3Q0_9PLEO|nr:hypothetical protein P154DRAFT_558740 [Amniculicola lignicola CBS 123094]